ncbi:cyclin-dependent kinase 2-interacting protein-like isoform X2 [Microplitis mediator]|uniref:cyclin-dependent kinase 2-interacting protein-like isoform X2 n=1 Tax=Microplitis mediator TaxID=375433 RepID=UPI002552BDD5|nr:cyclin-dependent kinase 2-interacting protein-like isoform X2 [Microplitis mediator]
MTIYPASPKASPQKNLTGNPRIIKDLAADIHRDIQTWNGIHLHGLSIIKSITAIKTDESFPEGLQELCDQLENDINLLDETVVRLNRALSQIKTVSLIHNSNDKLFIIWTTQNFEKAVEQIYEAYREEARLKRKILENVAHGYSDSWKMLHLAAWVHQPMIPHNLNVTLESLLVETGHR